MLRRCPPPCCPCTTRRASRTSAAVSRSSAGGSCRSGGTARTLADAGLEVTDLAELTGYPAILGHRVVTLHPVIHGGLLADLDQPEHVAELAQYGIEPFALAVVNLYPFASEPGHRADRHRRPHARARRGEEPRARRRRRRTAAVRERARRDPRRGRDSARPRGAGSPPTPSRRSPRTTRRSRTGSRRPTSMLRTPTQPALPPTMHLSLERVQPLRYGENPHQQGARYRRVGATSWWDTAVQHGGKELSYLNLFDTEAAWRLVHRFDDPAVVIVKHANPCGVAIADTRSARRTSVRMPAIRSAPSAGSSPRTARSTQPWRRRSPPCSPRWSSHPGTTTTRSPPSPRRRTCRVLTASPASSGGLDIRAIDGGLLVQQPDVVTLDRSAWRVVSAAQPTEEQWSDLVFAWQVCAAVSSNAIVFAKRRSGARDRRRPAEPRRLGPDRRGSRRRSRGRRRVRERRVLPVRGQRRGARRRRDRVDHRARRQRPRRRGDRRRRCRRDGRGVHRGTPLPPLTSGAPHPASPGGSLLPHGPHRRPPRRRPHVLLRVLPAEVRGRAADARAHDRASSSSSARASSASRTERAGAPAQRTPRGGRVGPQGDVDHTDGPPHLRRAHQGGDRRAARRLPSQWASRTSWRSAAIRRRASPIDDGEYTYAVELIDDLDRFGCFSVGVAAHPEVHPRSADRDADRRHLAAKLRRADFAITPVLLRGRALPPPRRRAATRSGVDKPVLPGIMPVTNVAQIQRMAAMSGAAVPAWLVDRLESAGDDTRGRPPGRRGRSHRAVRGAARGGRPGPALLHAEPQHRDARDLRQPRAAGARLSRAGAARSGPTADTLSRR